MSDLSDPVPAWTVDPPRDDGQPAAQRVLSVLRDMIIRGELQAGSRIVERTLCAQLNVSRTPMREALKLLEIDGLIEISQHRGARVCAFTASEALELFEVIAALEGLAAELAAARMGDAQIAELATLHQAMRREFDAGDRDAYFDMNTTVHQAIVAAAANRSLQVTHQNLMLRAKRGRYMAIVSEARWRQAIEEHDQLMAAFARRDGAEAGRIWRLHLIHTGETVAHVIAAAEQPD